MMKLEEYFVLNFILKILIQFLVVDGIKILIFLILEKVNYQILFLDLKFVVKV